MNIFHSILYILFFTLRLLVIFFQFFFFNPTDQPTQYQEMHLTVNEEKKGMA